MFKLKTVLSKSKLKRIHLQNQEQFEIEIHVQMKCMWLRYLYAGQKYEPFQQMNSLLLLYYQNLLSATNPENKR